MHDIGTLLVTAWVGAKHLPRRNQRHGEPDTQMLRPYGGQALGPRVPISMVKGGVTYRIISDHWGSPRLVTISASSLQTEFR